MLILSFPKPKSFNFFLSYQSFFVIFFVVLELSEMQSRDAAWLVTNEIDKKIVNTWK